MLTHIFKLLCVLIFYLWGQISTETLVVTETSITRTATFINYQTVVCTVPVLGSYRVALSNNGGVNTSEAFDFLAFDPTCVTCTAIDRCSILVGSLFLSL